MTSWLFLFPLTDQIKEVLCPQPCETAVCVVHDMQAKAWSYSLLETFTSLDIYIIHLWDAEVPCEKQLMELKYFKRIFLRANW